MPFVWVNEPQTPPQVEPLSYGPNAVSTQVGLVANTVVVHPPPIGKLLYNTPNVGYDVVYAYDSLNVDQLSATVFTGNNVFANNASLNTASIESSNIANAYIANLNVQYLFINTDPTANLHFATKGYVDSLIANTSPSGGNLQLLIIEAGDLLVGVADNTANRVAVGPNSSILQVNTSVNTQVSWESGIFPSTSSFRGLQIGTHKSFPACNNIVQLFRATEIVMDNGTVTNNWTTVSADITTNGAGGLDANTKLANTWYEVYAIRNPTTEARSLLFHRALDRRPHISSNTLITSWTQNQFLNSTWYLSTGGTLTTKIGQQFTAPLSGRVTSADILIRRVGTPNGIVWLTVHDQEANGFPNATILCTSDVKIAQDVANTNQTSGVKNRFIFRDGVTLTENNKYCIILNTDYSEAGFSSQNYLIAPGHANAALAFPQGGNCVVLNGNTGVWMNGAQTSPVGANCIYVRVFVEANNTAVTMPTGYTEKCLVSYACTDIFGSLKEYSQRDRRMNMPFHIHWRWYDIRVGSAGYQTPGYISPITTQLPEALDAFYGIPPIPCSVSLNFYLGAAPSFVASVGHAYASELIGGAGGVPTFREIDGSVKANTVGGGSFVNSIGPIYVEEQCVQVFIVSTNDNYYVTAVEF